MVRNIGEFTSSCSSDNNSSPRSLLSTSGAAVPGSVTDQRMIFEFSTCTTSVLSALGTAFSYSEIDRRCP